MASTNHNHICRGCGDDLVKTNERVVRVRIGTLVQNGGRTPLWKTEPPEKSVWGYMHERCFMLAVGDPDAIELVASSL